MKVYTVIIIFFCYFLPIYSTITKDRFIEVCLDFWKEQQQLNGRVLLMYSSREYFKTTTFEEIPLQEPTQKQKEIIDSLYQHYAKHGHTEKFKRKYANLHGYTALKAFCCCKDRSAKLEEGVSLLNKLSNEHDITFIENLSQNGAK